LKFFSAYVCVPLRLCGYYFLPAIYRRGIIRGTQIRREELGRYRSLPIRSP
jgi:hypothetical protein